MVIILILQVHIRMHIRYRCQDRFLNIKQDCGTGSVICVNKVLFGREVKTQVRKE